jgi:hypothetical protein
MKVWENKPLVRASTRRRFSGIVLQIDTRGAAATVTPVLDGVDQTALATTDSDWLGKTLTFQSLVGRDLWCRITSATPFRVSTVEPIVLETLPKLFQGSTPRSHYGDPGVKTTSGVQLRLCTLGVARTVTPIIDGTTRTDLALSVTTGVDDPDDVTLRFPASEEVVELALLFSGDVELYDARPLVTARRPLGVLVWDSGPIDLGTRELVWLREMFFKVRAGGDLTITPWFDGVAFPSVTATVTAGVDTVVPVPVGRSYVGRQPRLVVTSDAPFYPYHVMVVRRLTGLGTEKPVITVPIRLGVGASG